MKVAVAQINTKIGDFEGNAAKIIDRIGWARLNSADIVVFPEMAVTGYPPMDLLENASFVADSVHALDKIAKETDKDIAAVVGYVACNESTTGRGLFNSAAFLHEGRVKHVRNKTLLPNYDVFDEARYFEPGSRHKIVEYKGRRIGITICEDIWFNAGFSGRQLYAVDPVKNLVDDGAEFIVNISSSPYILDKSKMRERLLSDVANQYGVPVVYSNLVGGNDELIFDGSSLVIDGSGSIVYKGGQFVEDAFIVDIDDHIRKASSVKCDTLYASHSTAQNPRREEKELTEALTLGVRDYIGKCGCDRVVVGLSGGIDSAVVAAIAVEALGPSNVMGISMPSRYTSKQSIDDARKLSENLEISFRVIDIDDLFKGYLKTLNSEFEKGNAGTTEENIQSRIRGNILMAFSNRFDAIMLSTGNKSEIAVGYCTLYGDLAGGLAVISDVPKTLVYRIAHYMNRGKEIIPKSTIDRPPTAELRPGQKDQDELPPYDVLDPILKAYIEDRQSVSSIIDQGFDGDVVKQVVVRVKKNEYKRRQAPTGLKVTSKAFGWGRRYPIACEC